MRAASSMNIKVRHIAARSPPTGGHSAPVRIQQVIPTRPTRRPTSTSLRSRQTELDVNGTATDE